jgi:hypothetical protein
MGMILRSSLILLFCFMGSNIFAQPRTNEVKIYIPKNAICIEKSQIVIGKNNKGFRAKSIHSDQHGFYIYKNDALLQELVEKGYVYGCTKCTRVFYDYYDAADHATCAHGGRGRIYIKRKE